MNNEQQQIIDEVYEDYESRQINMFIPIWSQEEFINKCKTDPEFSEKWGLKIEERELSSEERWDWLRNKCWGKSKIPWDRMAFPRHEWFNEVKTIDAYDLNGNLHKGETINTPTKLIIITYNNETIESYD